MRAKPLQKLERNPNSFLYSMSVPEKRRKGSVKIRAAWDDGGGAGLTTLQAVYGLSHCWVRSEWRVRPIQEARRASQLGS